MAKNRLTVETAGLSHFDDSMVGPKTTVAEIDLGATV